ncbi:unnamed protein product, partial [Prorocentrum cordatum]
ALFALWRQAAAGGERRRHAQLRGCARATARLRGGLLLGAVVAWQAACAARRAAAVHAVGLRRRRQACEACSLIALSGRALLMLVGAFAWWRRALSAALLARMASRARGLQEARDAAAALLAAERSRALLGAAFAQWRAAEASLEGAGAHKRSSGPRREAGAASRAHVWLAAVLVQWHQAARGRRQEAALRRAGEDGRSRGLREARGFAVDVLVIDRRRSLLGLVWARWRESWHAAKSAAAEAALRGAGEGGRSLGLREARGFAVDVLAIDRRRSLLEVAWATWRVSWHATKSAVAGAALERARAARGTAMSLLATSRCRSWLAAVLARWWQMSQDAAANAAAEAALERARADGRSRGLQEARAWAAGLLAASHTLSRLASVFTQWRHASQLGARVTATEAELARVRADSLSSGLRDARIGVASLLAASCDRSWLAAVLTKWYLASQLAKRTTAAEAADARSHKLREALDVAASHLTTSRSRFHIAAVFAEWRHASQLCAKVTATEAELARVRADSRSSGLRDARIGAASLLATSFAIAHGWRQCSRSGTSRPSSPRGPQQQRRQTPGRTSFERQWTSQRAILRPAALVSTWPPCSQSGATRLSCVRRSQQQKQNWLESVQTAGRAGSGTHELVWRACSRPVAIAHGWRQCSRSGTSRPSSPRGPQQQRRQTPGRTSFERHLDVAAGHLTTSRSRFHMAAVFAEWRHASQLGAKVTATEAELARVRADSRSSGLRDARIGAASLLAASCDRSWLAAVLTKWYIASQLTKRTTAAEAADARSHKLREALDVAAGHLTTSRSRFHIAAVFAEWRHASQLGAKVTATEAELARVRADSRSSGLRNARIGAASLLAASCDRSWLAAVLTKWYIASQLTKRTTAAEAADARSHKLREALDVAAGHLTTSRSRFHIAAVFAEWRHAFQAAARSAAYEKALERACADNRSRGFRDGRECAANFLATRLSHYWLATACMEWHRVSQLAATRTAADSLADSFAATRSAALQNAYADGRMHGLREIKDNVARVLANIHSLSWVAAVFAVWCRVSQLASKSAAAEAALRTACAEARSSGLQAARGIAASILATSCDRSWLTSVFVEWCRVSQLATTSAAMGAKLQRAGADGRLRGSIESRERAASLLAATRSRSWLAALLACWFQASRLEALMRWRTRYSQDLALWKQLAGKSQHHNSLLMSFHGWQRATSKAKVDTLRGRSKIMLLDRMISQMQEGLMIVLAEWRRAHAVCALRRSAEVQAEGSARRLAVACRLQAVRGCEWLLGLSCRRPAALAAALLEWRRRATRALLRRTVSAVAARSHRLQLAGLLSEWRGAAAASAERARAREGLRRGLEALGACALRGCSRRRVAAAWAAWQ